MANKHNSPDALSRSCHVSFEEPRCSCHSTPRLEHRACAWTATADHRQSHATCPILVSTTPIETEQIPQRANLFSKQFQIHAQLPAWLQVQSEGRATVSRCATKNCARVPHTLIFFSTDRNLASAALTAFPNCFTASFSIEWYKVFMRATVSLLFAVRSFSIGFGRGLRDFLASTKLHKQTRMQHSTHGISRCFEFVSGNILQLRRYEPGFHHAFKLLGQELHVGVKPHRTRAALLVSARLVQQCRSTTTSTPWTRRCESDSAHNNIPPLDNSSCIIVRHSATLNAFRCQKHARHGVDESGTITAQFLIQRSAIDFAALWRSKNMNATKPQHP